jgi:hypothetical protein
MRNKNDNYPAKTLKKPIIHQKVIKLNLPELDQNPWYSF